MSPWRPPGIARGVPAWLWAAWCAGLVAALAKRPRRAARLTAAGATAVSAAFFRDPKRRPQARDVLAAADGRVTAVDQLPDGRWRIATYMSLRDVHVNRAPAAGVVRLLERRPGGHVPAFAKDSQRNERVRWRIATIHGDLEVVQIAGVLARRIVPYQSPGDRLGRGERMGLIRFGSRVDVILPADLAPAVKIGDRLRAGESTIAS